MGIDEYQKATKDKGFNLAIRNLAYLLLYRDKNGDYDEAYQLFKYLYSEGECKEVALAVLEHYQPRYSGDELPKSNLGALLALVERIELLLSIYANFDYVLETLI